MQVDDKLICKLLVGHDDPRGWRSCSIVIIDRWFYGLTRFWVIFRRHMEDPVQDFFVAFWEQRAYARNHFRVIFGDIFFASVRNRALKLLEKRDPLREACGELNENAEVEDTDWLTEEILQAIEAEIEKLPPRTREVLKSVYLDGLSYRETADRFSISIATVKTLLVNALKYLRKVFSGFWHFRSK